MKMKTMKSWRLALAMLAAFALASCSDDDFSGDPDRDWQGTTTFFTPTDAPGSGT